MNMGERVTFNELLDIVNFIEIPIIQRDYAQGRKDQSEVRNAFLDSLFSALIREKTYDDQPSLNLDFVYGDIDNTDTLSVLDGQQRLTTLFLLHWFLAVKYNHLTEFKARFTLKGNSRFTYKTRPSSSEFFNALLSNGTIQQRYHALTKFNIDQTTGSSKINDYTIDQLIADSTWFFSAWKQDPTVQACLNMLKAIEERFALCNEDLYLRIVDSDNPCITFQFLPLSKFGLSDELYIKMNARGKPLTPFENFKANLQQTIKSFSKELPNYDLAARGGVVNGYEYFIHKIDTDWADLFWTYRTVGDKHDSYDDELMNFIRLIILYQYVIDTKNNDSKSEDNLNTFFGQKAKLQHLTIAQYTKLNCFTPNFVTNLIALLDLLDLDDYHNHHLKTYLPDAYNKTHYSEVSMFEKVLADNTSYPEKLRFYAFYRFLSKKLKSANSIDANDIQSELVEWIRVIYNLTENTIFNTSKDFLEALLSIEKLSKFDSPILDILTNRPGLVLSRISEDQLVEEKIKAHLILKSDDWKNAILQAENHPFFNGQIGCLLNFSGILEYYRNHNNCNWDAFENNSLLDTFKKYDQSLGSVFNLIAASSSDIEYLWERATLTKGMYFTKKKSYDRYNLLSTRLFKNNINRDHSWKRLLRIGSETMEIRQSYVKAVLDDPDFDANDIKPSLQSICDVVLANNDFDKWREYLIQYPQLFDYCEQGFIEISEIEVLLLWQSQRNHYHSELYTVVLDIQLKDELEKLMPFSNLEYQYVKSTQEQASLKIEGWNYANSNYYFEILKAPENFVIQFKNGSSNDYPQKVSDVIENNGLQREYTKHEETGDEAVHYEITSLTSVDDVISQLIQTCSSLRSIENE
ncbi:DUF262 domain-containing protein [Psychrobacter okhotskensis]|uniref:DUF262 domain-containing protein n=1 Tax=Psychrobacter okhotskensis TaxID=212403 RepID=UPI00156326DF|nr:DUF262 domain-containing protein [Psychrobacter okhotskensis]NRD70630.1 DUF262 domain-containing protein [Psychrobacter okhotskensis]